MVAVPDRALKSFREKLGGSLRSHLAQARGNGSSQSRMRGRVEVNAVDSAGCDDFLAIQIGTAERDSHALEVPGKLTAPGCAIENLVLEVRQMG